MADTNDVTRRDAVKLAGAAAATAAASQLQGAPAIQKVRAANDQVQYGMVGTGSRGTYLLKHLAGIDNGRCVALCDLKDDALQKGKQTIGGTPKMYKDYRELLSDKNVDAVLVITPLYQHFPVTKDALLAGKHVFCEKSLVFKPEEVHELRKLVAERPKQILQVGLQRRYSQYYQMVRSMIEQGVLGDVTHIQAQWHRNGSGGTWADKPGNWRPYRKFSGGLMAELASHQIDVADWMFGDHFEYVMGVGGLDTYKDGARDVYDNIQLIFKYPKNQKLIYSSISTNAHLPFFGSTRSEFGERIMGTQGTVEITVGTDDQPAIAIHYREAAAAKVSKGAKPEAFKAGATMTASAGGRGQALVLAHDEVDKEKDSFLTRELKFARRWLYSKGVMMPEEVRNPVDTQLMSFFDATKTGKRPHADLEVGLADSTAVILANLAMDEGRRVYFHEIDKMGKGGAAPAADPKAARRTT